MRSLTLKEWNEIPQSSIVDITRPLVEDHSILRMELDRVLVCIHHYHTIQQAVQPTQVLKYRVHSHFKGVPESIVLNMI
jgi:hypothetical protein